MFTAIAMLETPVCRKELTFPLRIKETGLPATPENLREHTGVRLAVLPIDMPNLLHLQTQPGALWLGITKQGEAKEWDFPNWPLNFDTLPRHCKGSKAIMLEDAAELVYRQFTEKFKRRGGYGGYHIPKEHYGFLGAYLAGEGGRQSVFLLFGAPLPNHEDTRKFNVSDDWLYVESYETLKKYCQEEAVPGGFGEATAFARAVLEPGDLPRRIAGMKPARALALLPDDYRPGQLLTFPIKLKPQQMAPRLACGDVPWHVAVYAAIDKGAKTTLANLSGLWNLKEPGKQQPLKCLELCGDDSAFPLVVNCQTPRELTAGDAAKWISCVLNDQFCSKNLVNHDRPICSEKSAEYLAAFCIKEKKELALVYRLRIPDFYSSEGPVEYSYEEAPPYTKEIPIQKNDYTKEEVTAFWLARFESAEQTRFEPVLETLVAQIGPALFGPNTEPSG